MYYLGLMAGFPVCVAGAMPSPTRVPAARAGPQPRPRPRPAAARPLNVPRPPGLTPAPSPCLTGPPAAPAPAMAAAATRRPAMDPTGFAMVSLVCLRFRFMSLHVSSAFDVMVSMYIYLKDTHDSAIMSLKSIIFTVKIQWYLLLTASCFQVLLVSYREYSLLLQT